MCNKCHDDELYIDCEEETYSNELLIGLPEVDYDIDVDNWWYEREDYM